MCNSRFILLFWLLIVPAILFPNNSEYTIGLSDKYLCKTRTNKLCASTLKANSDTIVSPIKYILDFGYIMGGFGFGFSDFFSNDIEENYYTNANIVNGALNLAFGARVGFKNIIEYEHLRSVNISNEIKTLNEKIDRYVYQYEHLIKFNPWFRNNSEVYTNLVAGIGNFKYTDNYGDGWRGTSYIAGMEFIGLVGEKTWYTAPVIGLKFYKIKIDEDYNLGIISPCKLNAFSFTVDIKCYFGLGL